MTHLSVVEGKELIPESADLTVHNQTLEIDVSGPQTGKTWSLVATPALQADEPVLHDIYPANTVLAGDLVDGQEKLGRVGDSLLVSGLKLDWQTLLEEQSEVLWRIWGLPRVDSELPHVLWWRHVGVLKNTGLVAAVCQVLVHTPRLALGAGNGDTALSGVVEQVVATLEAVVELWVPPWCNDLDVWLKGVEGQLEADLVVTLTGAAVGNGKAALLLSDLDLGAGDDWAGERGTEEVDVLVDGVALDGWPAELLDELFPEVLNVALLGSNCECLLLSSLEVLLLADVGHEADHAIALVKEVFENAGGVETTAVRETDLRRAC